ncbi:unnamed protein product [Rotaria sordida]|uniref:Uncharacterized protein n=1 Tax=Rotaria sordida TaxID=392033 RepID=A0A819S455_9BILA|nr:unnamed protein product [Rotaria sordida]CAF4053422.1 unnamed protein product [Rotaria sordida]
MPTGKEFSVEVKQLLFRVIDFVENEKDGPIVPLNNVDERLVKMLNISQSSITRLKHELKVLREQAAQQEQQLKEEEANQVHCLRSHTTQNTTTKRRASSSSLPPRKIPHRRRSCNVSSVSSSTIDVTLLIPQPIAPQKKSARLAVSALISVDGYRLRSIDIWACTEEHQMNSDRFLSWLDPTCATLRSEIGDKQRIAICLDNAPWYNVLTDESIVPKRSSRKEFIGKWLKDRDIEFPKKFLKAQLLELVSANAPAKEFLVDPFE